MIYPESDLNKTWNNTKASTVSVVVPLYNKGGYIERALSSVLAQTHAPLEIIIVDDGSTDDGPERVQKFKDARIILISQGNKGPGAARNAGLAMAKGKYITFLDADDEWLPTFLERGVAMLEDREANVTVVFTGFHYSPDTRRRNPIQYEELGGVFEITGDTDLSRVRRLIGFHWTCATIVRSDVIRQSGGFFDRHKCLYGEDVYLFLKLMFNERIGIIPEPLAIYHTEASHLYGGGSLIRNSSFIAPYLEYPEEMLASCPQSTLHIMKKELATIAIGKARNLAMLGRKREATELLERFTRNGYPHIKGTLSVRLLVIVSPLLPAARRVWRAAKSMAALGRAQQ
jgi:glycosyltransferase involved in cell wall biosynthesis